MLYKLYTATYEDDAIPSSSRYEGFVDFYEENGVKVIGGWKNADKENEFVFMTAYKDEDHYNKFVDEMKNNEQYKKLTHELMNERRDIEVKTLIPEQDMPEP